MLTIILLAVTVPSVSIALFLALRGWLPYTAGDARGIALQTVIIMVVLLAIAGAIAGVLLTRGGEAVSDVERQEISRSPENFNTQPLCRAAGFEWQDISGTDYCASGDTTSAACEAKRYEWRTSLGGSSKCV